MTYKQRLFNLVNFLRKDIIRSTEVAVLPMTYLTVVGRTYQMFISSFMSDD
jgi:hypothetical protein